MSDNGLIAVDKVANKVRFYDPEILAETKVLDGPEPCVHELALSADRTLAFVPLYGDGIYGSNRNPNNKIVVIDLSRREIADLIDLGEFVAPHGLATTRDGRLWVCCDISGKLLCVDPRKRAVEAAYDTPARGPHIVEKLPDESKLYVSAKEGDLAAFDLARRVFVVTISMRGEGIDSGNGSGSEGLASSPDGAVLLAVDNFRTELRAIDTSNDREIERVPLRPFIFSNAKRSRLAKVAFSRDGQYVVATSYASAVAWVMPADDLSAQTVVPLAKGPMGIAFPDDGRSVLVTSHDSGLLTRIDLETGRAVAAYDGGAGIEVMAYY